MQGVCFHSFHWTVVQVGKWREDETKRWTKGPYLMTHNALKNWKIVKFTEKSICLLLLSQKDKIIDIFCEIFFRILKYYLLVWFLFLNLCMIAPFLVEILCLSSWPLELLHKEDFLTWSFGTLLTDLQKLGPNISIFHAFENYLSWNMNYNSIAISKTKEWFKNNCGI